MKLVINTAHQRFGGAIQVALSFINECRHFPEHEYHVWVGPGVAKSLQTQDFPTNFTFYYFDFGVITLTTIFKIQKALSQLEQHIKPDVSIATSGPTYFYSKLPQIVGFNLGLYIYPESPYVKELSLKARGKLTLKKALHYYFFKRDTTAYVVQTEDVNQRVRKALSTQQVVTVTNTHNGYFLENKKYDLPLPQKQQSLFRLVTLTSYYAHKNLELLPLVAQELESLGITTVQFVLTLKPSDFEQHISPHPFIVNIGPIQPEACPSLYRECDALFLPTLAECFSASYPEAMVMEKPIITTDLGFARSICGEAALYFEPKNAKEAALCIKKILDTPELSQDLVKQGKEQLKKFDTATQRAQKYLELCTNVISQNKQNETN